jgi:hypothetical protein
MQCKHHPHKTAEYICAVCNAPLCGECVEEVKPGVYACFQCAMLQSVSEVGSELANKHETAVEKETKKKKRWGPFRYFALVSSVLILVMWGVILFGGKPAPTTAGLTLEKGKAGRVLLFLVDSALKRYAHYEGNRFPESLSDLAPKYLQLKESQIPYLNRLSYVRDPNPQVGYRLSLADQGKGEMKIILSLSGIQQAPSGESKSK